MTLYFATFLLQLASDHSKLYMNTKLNYSTFLQYLFQSVHILSALLNENATDSKPYKISLIAENITKISQSGLMLERISDN